MVIKPLYLFADSQLLFWKDRDRFFVERFLVDMERTAPKAAYIGASNGDNPEFYSLFRAAMESIGLTDCRMIPARPSAEDQTFLHDAHLILLAGGDVEKGWKTFEENGLKELITRKRLEGTVLVGVSAGAVQLGTSALVESSGKPLDLFRFAPFSVGVHEEDDDWWSLRQLQGFSNNASQGIGIPAGAGAVYSADGSLEPVRKPLIQLLNQDNKITECVLLPLGNDHLQANAAGDTI